MGTDNKETKVSKLCRELDSITGLGYKIKFTCEMGGFFMIKTTRTNFDGKKFKMKQTLGKDSFDDDKVLRLIYFQMEELTKKFDEWEKSRKEDKEC